MEDTIDDVEKAAPFGELREFAHEALQCRLVLRKCPNDLVQRDMDKFMKRFGEQPQGGSVPEDNGKTLRAAFRADWIESLTTPGGPVMTGNDVDNMKPAHVRWAAEIIDRVYTTAREIPNA
jgi:hypothetical protein